MRVRAKFGMHRIGEQEPYFSLTCDTEEKRGNRWIESGGGAAHELIVKHFPELSHVTRWHLCMFYSGPMHYIENAVYWWQKVVGRSKWEANSYDPNPLQAFKSTIVAGAIPDDDETIAFMTLTKATDNQIRSWLMKRRPELILTFLNAMSSVGIEV